MEKSKAKYAGVIVKHDELYYFRGKNGKLVNIVQDAETKKLYDQGALVLLEMVESSYADLLHGKIIEVIGKSGDPIPEGRAIARSHNLVREPSKVVLSEVDSIPMSVSGSIVTNGTSLRSVIPLH